MQTTTMMIMIISRPAAPEAPPMITVLSVAAELDEVTVVAGNET